MGGNVEAAEREDEGAWDRAKRRLPWLIALLFGELMAGNVVHGFQGTLETFTVLAVFIPVLIGGAGNAATQSLAVAVRAIATGDIDPRRIGRVVWREVQVGMVIGVVTGSVLAVVAGLWQREPLIGAVIGAIIAVIVYALQRGRRDFAAVTFMGLRRFELVVDDDVADRAARLLAEEA